MIKYIVNNAYGSIIYQTKENCLVKKSNLGVVKDLCLDNLFTYEGYLKAIKLKFKKAKLIPVYIYPGLELIPSQRVRDYENIWINYASLKTHFKFSDTQTKLIFIDDTELVINLKHHLFLKGVKFLEKVRNYKLKPFHKHYH